MTRLYKVLDVKINGRMVNEGDIVKVKPTPGRRDGFDGRFMNADIDDEGRVHCVTVYGGRGERKAIRSFLPERIATYRKQKELPPPRPAAGRGPLG